MGALAMLLAPYRDAVAATPTTPASLGMGLQTPSLMDMVNLPGEMGRPPALPSGGSPSEGNRWEQIAAQMAQRRYGWGPEQFSDIDEIITQESAWNPDAVNPSSGAYGIPQILPAAHPDDLGLGPRQQISWLLDYIKGRYGSPSEAADFKQQQGWY